MIWQEEERRRSERAAEAFDRKWAEQVCTSVWSYSDGWLLAF